MMPIAPCSPSNTSFVPGTSFTARKTRYFSSQRLFITHPKTTTLFPQLRNGHPSLHLSKFQSVSSIGTDVAVELHNIPASDEAITQEVETNGEASADVSSTPNGEASGESEVSNAPNGEVSAESDVSNTSIMAKKRRGRKSEMPPVKNEDLIPGAIFTGKIRSVQPFGAFVDFGAFTDGLVHVSRLSDNFVKDVNDVVSLGQEVKVRLVEANTETGRISLSMRDNDVSNDSQKNTDKPRSPRSPRKTASMEGGVQKKEFKKTSKFLKGQDLVGTVKNFGRSGAFISLPEDEEGFLPTSEEPDDGFGSIMGQTSLEVGQEVKVRVLRIARGIMTLTMKKEEDVGKLESKLNQGAVHTATNPFFIAFRRNKDIAAFLDDRDKIEGIDETMKQANSNDSEEISVSNVESESLDVASLITKEETQTESSSDSTEEVVKEISMVEAIEEIPTPEEGNGNITSSIEGEN